jgi:hypothetical protein
MSPATNCNLHIVGKTLQDTLYIGRRVEITADLEGNAANTPDIDDLNILVVGGDE